MILTAVRDFCISHHTVTVSDVANSFDIAPSAAEGMLQRWVAAGVLTTKDEQPCGSACAKSCALVTHYHAVSY